MAVVLDVDLMLFFRFGLYEISFDVCLPS